MSDLRADAPAEVRFLFQESRKRSGGAMAMSFAVHVAMFGLAFWVARNARCRPDHASIRQTERSDRLARRTRSRRRRWWRRQSVARAGQAGRAQGQREDHRAGRETAGDRKAQRQTAGRSPSEPDDSGADACVCRSRASGSDGRDSDIRLARTRPRRWRRNRAGHGHRFGSWIWAWRRLGRRHRRRRVSSGQRRRDPAPAQGSEAAVHRAGDARENSGRSAARVHRPA